MGRLLVLPNVMPPVIDEDALPSVDESQFVGEVLAWLHEWNLMADNITHDDLLTLQQHFFEARNHDGVF